MQESPSLTSPADIIEVANIDIACSLEDPEVHPNGKGSFVVYYGRKVDSSGMPGTGAPIVVEAGQTRMFPRYIAEHFRDKLADHILTSKELKTDHPKERPILLKEIFRDEQSTFAGEPNIAQVEVDNTPLKEPEVKVEPVVKQEPVQPLPTRKELFAELKEHGVTTTGKESVADLMEKIEKVAYG